MSNNFSKSLLWVLNHQKPSSPPNVYIISSFVKRKEDYQLTASLLIPQGCIILTHPLANSRNRRLFCSLPGVQEERSPAPLTRKTTEENRSPAPLTRAPTEENRSQAHLTRKSDGNFTATGAVGRRFVLREFGFIGAMA